MQRDTNCPTCNRPYVFVYTLAEREPKYVCNSCGVSPPQPTVISLLSEIARDLAALRRHVERRDADGATLDLTAMPRGERPL